MVDFEVTVIGGGVVGLSIARELSFSGKKVLVIEKNSSFGQENSSRNSGVIHAGIYYPQYSLKNKFCSAGNVSLYSYAKERGIGFSNCGKIVVATSKKEEKKLNQIILNAERNGLILEKLSQSHMKELEPELVGKAGLLSRTTGVIDIHDLMLNFIIDIENNGGIISFNSEFSHSVNKTNHISFFLKKDEKQEVKTKSIINSTGLHSHLIATKIDGINADDIPVIRYIKGNYLSLSGKSPFKKLIYPLPEKNGLGIHSTLNLDGVTIFGPDTVEVEEIDFHVTKNIKEKFLKSISKYWPEVKNRNLNYDYCGIRPKHTNHDFSFFIKKLENDSFIINLFGIESPGLTSSIQIGEYVLNIFKN